MNKTIPFAFYAAMNGRRETLKNRIARFTEYVKRDKELCAKSAKHARRYASRLRNHEAKLERYKTDLTTIEATLANA